MFDPIFTHKFDKFVGGKLWSITRYHFLRQAVLGKYEDVAHQHRVKKGVSVFVTVTSRKPEYPQTEL